MCGKRYLSDILNRFMRLLKKVEKIMNIEKIGRLIKYQRTEQSISKEKLAAGICSVVVLKRIEAGERCGDFFTLERLISRLGKSNNKIELIQDEKEYELFLLRERMNEKLRLKKYDEAEKMLAEYENILDKEKNLYYQYIETIKGVICSEKYKNHKEAEKYFYNAINITLPKFSVDKIDEYLLAADEVIILLLYLKNKGKIQGSFLDTYGNAILNYIDSHFQDEEIKCNLYSKSTWIIGDSLIKNRKYEEALSVTMKAENMLVSNGILLNVPQLLDRIIFLSKNNDKPIYNNFKKMRDALKGLYKEYDIEWNTEDINLIIDYKQKNVYLISEFIKQERKFIGVSQQKLSEDLDIDIKTVSRIENGKVLPKKGTFQKILNYFDEEREVAESRIVTNDFYLLEMERKVAKLNAFHKYGEAEALYKEIKARIPLEYKRNKQYVELMDALFDREMERCELKEIVDRLIKAFNITRGDMGIDRIGEFILSKAEAVLINNLAICYALMDMKGKSIELLEKAVSAYKNSKIELKYRYVPLALMYTNLCCYYEETNQFKKAIELIDKTIKYSIECFRGDFLGFLLVERTYAIDRMTGDNIQSIQKYKQSYQLKKLMKESEQQKAPLKRAFKQWYGEEIE